jgi:hypothetical protein
VYLGVKSIIDNESNIFISNNNPLVSLYNLITVGVESRSLSKIFKETRAQKRSDGGCWGGDNAPSCCATSNELSGCCDDKEDEEEDDEPKRLVVYFNFEKVLKHGRISDKSGYENSGTMTPGGEILKFNDKDYTCNQAARLWDHDIILRGDTFQAKPKTAITIAAWVKMEEHAGQHSIFDTVGTSHAQGQFHFEVNDGVARWFHRDEKQKVVFETMAHTVPKGRWVHVAGTYDSKTKQAKVFINGEIRNQSLGDGALSRDWGVRAGIGNKEKNRPLRGSIDEFRIYNYALKPDEIKALVSACKATVQDAASESKDEVAQKSDDAPAPSDNGGNGGGTSDDSGGGASATSSNNGDSGGSSSSDENKSNQKRKKRSTEIDNYSYYI